MEEMKASRLTALVAVIVAVSMLGLPASVFGNEGLDPVGSVSAADGSRVFTIGVNDMTIATLNPNTYTMVAEGMAIFPMYSYLMQWDASGEHIIGDLAVDWWTSPDGLTFELELNQEAYFVEYDADTDTLTKGPQVTSADVEWSILTLAAEDGSRLHSYWPDFDGVNIIADTWCDDAFHFGITIREPFVPFQESLMGTPIFPKYIWENVDFLTFDNIPFVGSGAFYYKTDGMPDAGTVTLGANPYWHGDVSYGWQLHVDEFRMKRYDDTTTLWEAVKLGDVDAMMGVDPGTYDKDLPNEPQLQGFSQSNGFVYEFNLNQMTDEFRASSTQYSAGGSYSNQLLLNHSVKKAISMCVDRNFLIDTFLFGLGTFTTTLVPNQNPMSHNYGEDGHDCMLDPGATEAVQDPFDPDAARDLLWDAGWRYDMDGNLYDKTDPDFATVVPLCNTSTLSGDDEERRSQVLSFRFITLNTGGAWVPMCNEIVGWCEQAGIELNLDQLSVNQMNSAWYAADYDLWLWDWVLYPYGEAVSSVLSLFTSYVIGTDSDVYISDPFYDAMYDEAIREMDYEKRKELCYDMQDYAYINRGCQALAFREDLYAFNINGWEDFGDLENEYFMLPDIWPDWLCAQMSPSDNHAPVIGGISIVNNTVSGYAEVGTAVSFSALGVSDDNQLPGDLEYKWIWGFGGQREVLDASVDHVFTEDGEYSITLVVRETAPAGSHADYLSTYYTTYLTVHDMGNSPPHDLVIEADILDPTAGELVTFTGSAIDDEDDDLYFTWNFIGSEGVYSTLWGPVVEHQFPADGSFTVEMLVDDHRYGEPGTRPVTADLLVPVGPNRVPSISVPAYGEISDKTMTTFTVMASDPDPRDELRFTWHWGDGSISVTDVPYADHSYNLKATYTITVYADDQTGLDGHNVSGTGTVVVLNVGNAIPAIVVFEVEPVSGYMGQVFTFTAIAGDGDGDALTFTFDWDDGTTYMWTSEAGLPNAQVECVVDKSYEDPGTYSVYLEVTDGTAVALSPQLLVTVEINEAPVISSFAPEPYYDTGVSMEFFVSADDADGDSLRYTWDWGDSTTTVTTVAVASHTFTVSDTYTVGVTVDDYKGLSDYAEADVTVNRAPYISPLLSPRSVDEDEANDYSVSAHDDDGDALTCMWDFGDSTGYVFGPTVSHIYADPGTYTYRVWVWDSFEEYRPVTHNVTSSSTVTVGSASVDDPPVIDLPTDFYGVEGQPVQLTASASDDGGDELLTYIWDFGDLSPLLVGDPPVSHVWATADEYTLTLWVHDESGIPENNVSAIATVHIEVDDPPTADAGGDRTVDEETSVGFTAAASYDDVEIIGYEWTVYDYYGEYTFDTEAFTYTFQMPGEWYVDLVVEDCINQFSAPDEILVTVNDVTAPVNVSAGDDRTVANNTAVTFSGTADDADAYDDELDFSWEFIYDGQLRVLEGQTTLPFTFEVLGSYVVTLIVEDDAGNSAEDDMVLVVEDQVPPVANAGEDQTVDQGDTVTFDGSGSYDADSELTYEWTFVYDGGDETLNGVAPTFVFDIAGTYEVTLTVTDEGDNTASDTMTVTVNAVAANDPPVADAGADQDVDVGETVSFDGSDSSDSDGTIESYEWTFTYNGSAETLTGETPTFVFWTEGTYTVTLEVTDDDGATATDTVVITVTEPAPPANEPPVADAGDDQTVDEGTLVTFDGSGSSDSDGTIATYTWTFTYDGTQRTLTGVSPTFTFADAGTYTVVLTVTDDDGDTGTDTVVITVEEAEEEPPPEDDGKSFLESYGLPIAIIVIVIVVLLVVLLLMKRKKSA